MRSNSEFGSHFQRHRTDVVVMKFRINDIVTTQNGTRKFVVMEDTTDETSLVKLQTQVLRGTTMVWEQTRAPINDLIKITQTGEQQ